MENCERNFKECHLTLSVRLTSSEDMGCTVTSLLLGLGFSGAVPLSENLGSGATNELFPEKSQKSSTNRFNQMNSRAPSEIGNKDNDDYFI